MTADAPSPNNETFLLKSMALLGWDAIRQKLSAQALSPSGRERLLNLLPHKDLAVAQISLRETREMVSLEQSGAGLPLKYFADLRPIFEDANERLLLAPEQCLQILDFLRLTNRTHKALANRENLERLYLLTKRLDPLADFRKELGRCVDEDGEIRDNASPELKTAVRETGAARQKLDKTVTAIFSDSAYKDAIQDFYHTEREGRAVIPVKTENRSRLEGIVHDSSGSGATLFMEPTRLIPLNNQLKICKLRVEQERQKILGALARGFLDLEAPLMNNLKILTELDCLLARAKLAKVMDANFCPLETGSRAKLIQVRNPELVLGGERVVPNDIEWETETRVIVISGPNTGGKTATLKTAGLCSLMARSGLFLPAAENSEIGFFPEVYADIGDDQSMELHLSTFSGHLDKLRSIFDHARPGALILLDELGISTDPDEGGALAEAVLMELKKREMTTLVSTHYLSLKMAAQTQDGFLNASVQFDADQMKPTYRLAFGVPGKSAALETAENMGLPGVVLKKARELVGTRSSQAHYLLDQLNDQLTRLAVDKSALENRLRETENLRDEQKQLANELKKEKRTFNQQKSKQLQDLIRKAKQEIRQMIDDAGKKRDSKSLRKVERELESRGRMPLSATSDIFDEWNVDPDLLRQGDAVIVDSYGTKGFLLEDPKGKQKIRLQLGNLETVIEKSRLRGNARAEGRRARPRNNGVEINIESASDPRMTVNLHGMKYEEAQDVLEKFINQAVRGKLNRVTIIHGHGSGVLKKMVREYLGKYGLGKSFGPGKLEEGGDAVTVLEF